uniref:Complex I assembly factor TIMMDC1, mitochondrial n=1 Tax=Sinocyclocheilus rhinocerous TaxID=307959 RepID=A0A673IRP6_9TELE
ELEQFCKEEWANIAKSRCAKLVEMYLNRLKTLIKRSAHNAAIRGFVRFGWRWSWRVAAFVTMFNTVSTGLTVYRDKNALSHFAAAGGKFTNSSSGGTLAHVILLPAGVVVIGLQKLAGETMHDKRQRERRELHEQRVAEWNARLKLTDDLIGEMKCEKHQDTDNDLQRIEELLNQPRNEKGAKSSDSQ